MYFSSAKVNVRTVRVVPIVAAGLLSFISGSLTFKDSAALFGILAALDTAILPAIADRLAAIVQTLAIGNVELLRLWVARCRNAQLKLAVNV
jgi:hypothetical protein